MGVTNTLSIGPLVLVGTQQGPAFRVTIQTEACDYGAVTTYLTTIEWQSLTALVDMIAMADRRAAEDRAEIERLTAENTNMREFISASEECAKAVKMSELYEDNERYRAAFKQIVERVQSGDHTVRNAFCSWCQEAWPHLDGESAETAKEHARLHAYTCKSHPLRIERDAVTAERDVLKQECEQLRALSQAHADLSATRIALDAATARLQQLQPIVSVLGDYDWSGIVEDGCTGDDALRKAAEAMAYVEREMAKEQGNG